MDKLSPPVNQRGPHLPPQLTTNKLSRASGELKNKVRSVLQRIERLILKLCLARANKYDIRYLLIKRTSNESPQGACQLRRKTFPMTEGTETVTDWSAAFKPI